jgi:hypothetical protein
MGTSLSGLTPADTYQSLIKVGDNSALSATLKTLSDGAGNDSPLKLSTTAVQIVSPLIISTDDPSDMYLDCEDGSQNNRFNITRNISSQQVNLNFASNPAGSTTIVGAVRTYVDGTNLSEVMKFREDGQVTAGYLAVMGSPINDALAIHLGGSQVFQVGNPIVTDQFMVIDSVAGSKRGIKFGNQGSTRQGLFLNNNDLQIAECNTTNYNPWLTIDYLSNGNVTIGAGATTSIGAKLGIKGSGSTSATTSLLVQNSLGTQAFKIDDNLTVVCSGLLNVTSAITSTFLSGGGTAFTVVDDNGTFIRNSTWNFNRTSLNAWIGGVEEVSSLFTLNSTTKGFLPPRMTTTQINAIVSPAEGLVAYNTTISHLCCYQAGAWQKFNHSPM